MFDPRRKILTLVYAYYDNPNMYRRQVEEWNAYPERIKRQLSIIVTDDCSFKWPLRDITEKPSGIKMKRFQITEKKQWNWLACRNIGAYQAKSDWLLLTDMDHMVSVKSMGKLMDQLYNHHLDKNTVYLFTRVDAPNNTKYKPHNDSFLMTKKLYWKIGGYDEELSGNYGTSGRYRNRAFAVARGHYRLPIPLTRFPREIIPDASTTEFVRKGKGRDPNAIKRIESQKIRENRQSDILTLSFPYEEI
jgi:hypothetical protein